MFMLIYEQSGLDVELQEVNTITGEVTYTGIDNPVVVYPTKAAPHRYLFSSLEDAIETKEDLERKFPGVVYKLFKVEEVK